MGERCVYQNDHSFPLREAQVWQWYRGWMEMDGNDYYYFHLQNVPITEPYNTCTETNTCFNIYSLGPESMMVQLSILPQPSGKCFTKQMALPGFFTWVGGWRLAQPDFLIQYVHLSMSSEQSTLKTVYGVGRAWESEEKGK